MVWTKEIGDRWRTPFSKTSDCNIVGCSAITALTENSFRKIEDERDDEGRARLLKLCCPEP